MDQSESFIIMDDEYTFNEKLHKILKARDRKRMQEYLPSSSKGEGIIEKLNYLFKKEKFLASKELEFYSKLVKKQPHNPKARLKMAELYQKQKDHPKAVAEYLMAAEIYSRNNLFPQAMAIYKQVLKQNHGLDQVHFKIADIYRQMGFLGDAFYRYNLLLQRYNINGNKEKAMEVMGLMADLDPRKFTLGETPSPGRAIADLSNSNADEKKRDETTAGRNLGEERRGVFYNLGEALDEGGVIELKGNNEISMEAVFGFKEILAELKETAGPSKAYPNFNFHMGVACREMGFIDEAIEQFQVALEKRQNPFESAQSLSWCYKEKGWWEEARQTLEIALQLEELAEEKRARIKKDLDSVAREIEREKEILGGFNILPLDSLPGRSNKKTPNPSSDSGFDIQDAVSH